MNGVLLLDVVVVKSPLVLKLLACEDQSLGVGWDALLVSELLLESCDSVSALDVESEGLASQSLDKDLLASPESKEEVNGALSLDVVVSELPVVLKVLASENESLLVNRDSFPVVELLLQVSDGLSVLERKSPSLASESSKEKLSSCHCIDFIYSFRSLIK